MKVLTGVFPRMSEEKKENLKKNGFDLEEREGFIYVYKERRKIQEEIEEKIQCSHR